MSHNISSLKKALSFRKLRLALMALVVVCLGSGFSSCNPSINTSNNSSNRGGSTVTVKISCMTWPGCGPGYVGAAKGFFRDINLDIRILDDTRPRHAAYASEYWMMITNPDQHAREAEEGLPGKLFLVTDVSHGADGIVALNSIKTVADLKGKRIAYTVGSASDYFLSKALERGGVKRSEVTLRSVDDPSLAIAALNSGQVDAAVSWEPLMSDASKSGKYHILITTADIPDAIVGVFVAKDDVIQGDVAKRFLDGWFEAVEFIKSHPDEANEIMAKGMNVTVDDYKAMLAGDIIADRQLNQDFFCTKGSSESRLAKIVGEAAVYWKENGLLKNVPSTPEERLAPFTKEYLCKQ